MYEIEGPHSHGVAAMRTQRCRYVGHDRRRQRPLDRLLDLPLELPRAIAQSSF